MCLPWNCLSPLLYFNRDGFLSGDFVFFFNCPGSQAIDRGQFTKFSFFLSMSAYLCPIFGLLHICAVKKSPNFMLADHIANLRSLRNTFSSHMIRSLLRRTIYASSVLLQPKHGTSTSVLCYVARLSFLFPDFSLNIELLWGGRLGRVHMTACITLISLSLSWRGTNTAEEKTKLPAI